MSVLILAMSCTLFFFFFFFRALLLLLPFFVFFQGPLAAKKFIHSYILSRQLDVRNTIDIPDPKRYLSTLMNKQGRERPESRFVCLVELEEDGPAIVTTDLMLDGFA